MNDPAPQIHSPRGIIIVCTQPGSSVVVAVDFLPLYYLVGKSIRQFYRWLPPLRHDPNPFYFPPESRRPFPAPFLTVQPGRVYTRTPAADLHKHTLRCRSSHISAFRVHTPHARHSVFSCRWLSQFLFLSSASAILL